MTKKSAHNNKETTQQIPQQILDDFDNFLTKTTGVRITSLRDGAIPPYYIDTGCYALNWIITNSFFKGIPGTYNVLVAGDPGKGKSFLCDVILGNNVKMGGKSFKIDVEKSANFEFTKQVVGDENIASQIRIIKPEEGKLISIEKLSNILNRAIDYQVSAKDKKNKSIVFVIDSVTQLTTEKEVEIVSARDEGKKDKKDLTAAQKMRELFRTIEQKQEYANVTIIGIAQLTANISATGFIVPGTPMKVANVKGTGFNYASSLTIQMVADKEILNKDIPIGIKMKMKTTKNRFKYRGRDCWIYFYFNKGVDPYGGLIELLAKYGVIKASAKPKVSGEYAPSVKFTYIKNDNTELQFTQKNFIDVIEKNGGIELLKEWNEKLNRIYEQILNKDNISEEDYLLSEDEYEEDVEETEEIEEVVDNDEI